VAPRLRRTRDPDLGRRARARGAQRFAQRRRIRERGGFGVGPKGSADPDSRLAVTRARCGEQIVEDSEQAQPSVERPWLTAAVAGVAADLVAVDPNVNRQLDSTSRHRPSIGHENAPRIVATP
jgi:hypothetical protein